MVSSNKKILGQMLGATALGGILAMVASDMACAEQASDKSDSAQIGEVVVTANRRAEDVTSIPYNVTAVGGAQLARTGVSNIEDLSRQIPNLVVTSSGSQFLGAQRQIMRGLNASASNRSGVALEQNPVSTYLGNAPFGNFFQVDDISRVEVLRGPQGTLYGAGALGGAIRLIPADPELHRFDGTVSSSVGFVAHSGDHDYDFKGRVNIPLGDDAAVRISASHEYTAGFIDQLGVFKRTSSSPIAPPVLADPSSPLTSPAVTYTAKDVNSSHATNVRAALRWQPTSKFDVTLAYNFSRLTGFGPSYDTPDYNGGADPLTSALTYPKTGDYQVVSRALQPFERTSHMVTLDGSYDLGFATLSSTSSYFSTSGQTYIDATWGILGLPDAYLPYYTGSPANPRFMGIERFDDSDKVFTQEVRLVSKGDGAFDYVVGAFYQHETNTALWWGFAPGQTAYNSLPGVSVPGFNPGPADEVFLSGGTNTFTDMALFGELTWRPIQHMEVTGGVRLFRQTLDRTVSNVNPLFGLDDSSAHSNAVNGAKFRFNATYEYATGHRAYFTFSQGFRRGGANAFSLTGFLREPASLLDYKPDSVDNFEIGAKGRFSNGWLYTADVFYALWHNPQIGGFTAVNFWPAVFNGKEAESKGLELELSGHITHDLSFSAGYSYTVAKLTQNFCIPSGDGTGTPGPAGDIPCAIQGLAGTDLPSAPKHSGTMTLSYVHELTDKDTLSASVNANYKGPTRENLPTIGARYPVIPGYWLANLYLAWKHGPITTSVFARNLFDERVVYAINTRVTKYAPLDIYNTVGTPRTVGVQLSYDW